MKGIRSVTLTFVSPVGSNVLTAALVACTIIPPIDPVDCVLSPPPAL
jgi:hypothetical protein